MFVFSLDICAAFIAVTSLMDCYEQIPDFGTGILNLLKVLAVLVSVKMNKKIINSLHSAQADFFMVLVQQFYSIIFSINLEYKKN